MGTKLAVVKMDFVSPPPIGLDTECPICFGSLHVDPHQNLNCGHHLCGNCVQKLKKEGHNSLCPQCRAPLRTSADKSLQRVLKSLKVYCQHKGDGCTWQGDLGDLDHHEKDVCLYIKLSCPYGCEYIATRTLMDEHKVSTCSLRPANCKYCKFTSTYVDVNDNHYSVCSLYPITCSCDETIPRKDFDSHKKMTCPNTEVMCKFVEYGCEWKGMRKDEDFHLAVELNNHFMKVTKQLQVKLENNEVELRQMNKEQKFKVLRLEKSEVELRQMNKELEARVLRLEKNEVELHQMNKEQKTKVLRLEKSEVELRQMNKELEARVLRLEKNEVELRQMNKELEAKLGDKVTPHTRNLAKPKVERRSFVSTDDYEVMSFHNKGVKDSAKPKAVARNSFRPNMDLSTDDEQSMLSYHESTCSYSSASTEDEDCVLAKFSSTRPSSTPVTFTYKLNGFRKRQRSKKACYSNRFKISTSYWIQLRVHPNGTGKGKDSHVSVYTCLLQQPSQSASLVYVPPFRGSVHVSIRGVSGSIKKLISYNENTPSFLTACTSTSKSGYLASKGNGKQRFLPHEDLSKYLINGSLSFEVNVISYM